MWFDLFDLNGFFETDDRFSRDVKSTSQMKWKVFPPNWKYNLDKGRNVGVMTIDLPGVDPEKVFVSVEGNILVVEWNDGKLDQKRQWSFDDENFDHDKIMPTIKNGRLTIELLPKNSIKYTKKKFEVKIE